MFKFGNLGSKKYDKITIWEEIKLEINIEEFKMILEIKESRIKYKGKFMSGDPTFI
jgi:hypothetical protein